jgi:MerR family transcriptional regulator, thiopeptide resistance regulator
MGDAVGHTVSRLARMAGVSVRTLHHYDRIGLLEPTARSASGYRLYGEADLLRLQQVLFYRELDVPLARIKAILEDPAFDPLEALASHRALLEKRAAHVARLIETVDRTTARLRGEGTMLTDEELYSGFPREKAEAWRKEAEQRWGERYGEATRRVRSWSREKLAAVKAEGRRIEHDLAAAMDRGPGDARVQGLVGQLHQHLRHFYEPTPETIAGLGRMYVEHPDFKERYEAIRPGLADFLRDAMALYAESLKRRA